MGWDSNFSHPNHLFYGIHVLSWWPLYSHYSVLYEIPVTWEARMNFELSFRGWIPGLMWPPFDKTQVRRVVIDWQGARQATPDSVTVIVQCRYELPWSPL